MRIEQLRIDSDRLTMEEVERYSFIFGDVATRSMLLRAEDEIEAEAFHQEQDSLRSENSRLEDDLNDAQDELTCATRALDAIEEFLRTPAPLADATRSGLADLIRKLVTDPSRRLASEIETLLRAPS